VKIIREELKFKIPSKLNKDLYGNPQVDEGMLDAGNLTEFRSRTNLKYHRREVLTPLIEHP